MTTVIAVVLSMLLLWHASFSYAHSGRTDRYGCHAGSQPYHCHNSGSSSSGGNSIRSGGETSSQSESSSISVALAVIAVGAAVYFLLKERAKKPAKNYVLDVIRTAKEHRDANWVSTEELRKIAVKEIALKNSVAQKRIRRSLARSCGSIKQFDRLLRWYLRENNLEIFEKCEVYQ